jgi:hypothetical protein
MILRGTLEGNIQTNHKPPRDQSHRLHVDVL